MMTTKRMVSVAVALIVSATGLVAGAPAAQAAPCDGTYTIVVGGFNDSAAPSGWIGYLRGDHVNNYDFNVDVYSDDGNGQWFNGVFISW